MKLTAFIILITCLQVSASGYSQQISLSVKDAPVESVFTAIEKQTGFVVFYNQNMLLNMKPITITSKNVHLQEFLTQLLKDQPIDFTIEDKTILLSRRPGYGNGREKTGQEPGNLQTDLLPIILNGKVVDEKGFPLQGASVVVKGSKKGQYTNKEGMFSILVPDVKATVVISSVGYKTAEVAAWAANLKVIQLEVSSEAMNEVVINNGMFERNKQTFTGVTSTYSGKELRTVGRTNVIQSLKTLDPSFRVIDNNNFGSDPNKLPQIEFRGKTSPPIAGGQASSSQDLRIQFQNDPNQPLFILDGFEATLQQIVDLDINRVQSITLLKDAASTALYGSRSSNGVVIVETIRPKPGTLSISYSATGNLGVADLSGYNMMDASELLKFQALALDRNSDSYTDMVMVNSEHQKMVLRGVNTDWLNVPLRNAYNLNHSLNISGGEQFFSYNVALNYNSNVGVMKGSGRRTQGAALSLSYRRGILNIVNSLTINGSQGKESPYGRFRDYVSLPPYYEKLDPANRFLESYTYTVAGFNDPVGTEKTYTFYNPLYNANLPYKNESKAFTVFNNLNLNADITPNIRATVGLQVTRDNQQTDVFTSPLNTGFDGTPEDEKGGYDYSQSRKTAFSGNLGLIYNKVFAGKHIVNFNLRGSVDQGSGNDLSLSAVGFAAAAEPIIFLANSFAPGSKPAGSEAKTRRLSFITSLNYSFNRRFNADISYTKTGSNSFGSDNPYSSFYSAGLGWNLANERFIRQLGWFDQLQLSANYGLTGNENAGGFGSNTTYRLQSFNNSFGQSILLNKLGNPSLKWSRTYNASASLNASIFNRRLSLTLNGFEKKTDPMVVQMMAALSTGVTANPLNVGKLTTRGLELTLNIRAIQTRNVTWTLSFNSPIIQKSKYSGLGGKLEQFNKTARASNELQRYIDGSSPDDMYAVRSAGIDPATGIDLLLTKDGKYTDHFDINDEVKVGSSRPVTQGVVSTAIYYKKFSLNIYGRYVIGELKMNTALFDKVENITTIYANYDKRALYERWQKPGDDAYFRALNFYTQSSGLSSRFLQKENAFYCEAVSLRFDNDGKYAGWIKRKLGLKGLSTSLNFNEFFKFQFSNVKLERGLDYPFSRNITFSLNLVI